MSGLSGIQHISSFLPRCVFLYQFPSFHCCWPVSAPWKSSEKIRFSFPQRKVLLFFRGPGPNGPRVKWIAVISSKCAKNPIISTKIRAGVSPKPDFLKNHRWPSLGASFIGVLQGCASEKRVPRARRLASGACLSSGPRDRKRSRRWHAAQIFRTSSNIVSESGNSQNRIYWSVFEIYFFPFPILARCVP